MTRTVSVEDALAAAARVQTLSPADYQTTLQILEAYECWDPWVSLVKAHSKLHPECFVEDLCLLARIQIQYYEDVLAAADCCRMLVESSGMTFELFRTSVLDQVIDRDDFVAEGIILQSVWERFSAISDRIASLERICFIYEKKHHNETLLNQFYERLIKIHPENVKALRYFRTLYTQMQDWTSVVSVLKRLLSAAKHPQEVFRYAQELAAVYLYQLDDANNAIHYIEEHCSNSTLDTSTIHYEAYHRLGKYDGCLKVLRACLANIEDDSTKAVIHYRIASLFEQQGQHQLAFENYEKTLRLQDRFLEAIEGLVSTSIKLKNWTAVKEWLSVLASNVTSPALANQVNAGLHRLDEGVRDAVRS